MLSYLYNSKINDKYFNDIALLILDYYFYDNFGKDFIVDNSIRDYWINKIGKDSNKYKEVFKSKFKEISGEQDDTKWNFMTKKEFIQLFAKTIAAIDIDTQQRNKDYDDMRRERNKDYDDMLKERDAEELDSYNRKGDMFKTTGDMFKKTGGSRKTARKRIRRRRSSHCRRASIRKHKK